VSSAIRLIGKLANLGKVLAKMVANRDFSRRQVSTTETMAATHGPASSLPISIQFLLLWRDLHNRKNWLHVGSERAGPRVAAILPVVETCRPHQIPIRQYLSSVAMAHPNERDI
jgi:hypothetical protein